MKKQFWVLDTNYVTFACCVFFFLSIFVLTSCGYDESADVDASGTSETGSFACSLTWPDYLTADESTSQTSRELNCENAGTDKVVFTFYDSSDELLVAPAEFNCLDHIGRVDGLPVGTDYTVIIAARDLSGNDLYRGVYAGFSIVADGTASPPGGTITMERFEVDPNAEYTNSLGMGFNFVPAGIFTMGSPVGEVGRGSFDDSQHQVTLTQSFYIQTTEVTQGQWEAVMGNNPSFFSSCGSDCPVDQVSWSDVQGFIDALNSMGEGSYRLPTEAEWEYAARSGNTTALGNGNNIGVTDCGYDYNLNIMGWYCYNSGVTYDGCEDISGKGGSICSGTQPVALKGTNDWGLYDMHGNLWEWVQNWWEVYTTSDPVTDPTGPASGTYKMYRGGSWGTNADGCRSASKNLDSPYAGRSYIGFRLVRMP